MADEKKFHVGVKAMIENDKHEILVMLDSRHDNKEWQAWDFPGGRMNEGEEVLQTLQRELEEETGITAFKNPEFITAVVSTHEIKLSDETKVGLVLMVYKVQVDPNSKIVLSDEHSEMRWVSRIQAKELLGQARKYPKEFIDAL